MFKEFPIEQLATSATTRFQHGFARMTMHLMPVLDGVALEATAEGLKILATSEMALAAPGEVIRQIHADDVRIGKPAVRVLCDGSEPMMRIRAAVPYDNAETVVQELIGRGATIEEVDWLLAQPVVRARAPLRLLLGYPRTLETLSGGKADLQMSLSHYEPAPPGPGAAA